RSQRVHVGSIKEIDVDLEGAADEGTCLLFLEHPRPPLLGAIGHGAEAQARYFESGASEIDVVHRQAAIKTVMSPDLVGLTPDSCLLSPRYLLRLARTLSEAASPGSPMESTLLGLRE